MRLVGRERELAAIDAVLDDVERGSGGLLLITGEAGIGKTGLMRATIERARCRAVRVHTARASDLESDLAFGVARQLLAGLVLGVPDPDCDTLFEGAAALAAPVLSAAGPDPGEGSDEFAALHGLYWLTANLAAESPVLLAVDDAHWCDLPSLRFLTYLARRLDGVRVALVLAARSDEQPEQQALLDLLAAEPAAVTLRPAPLGTSALQSLLHATFGRHPEPAFVEACWSLTGGNPFLVRELLAEARNARVLPLASQVRRLEQLVPHGVRRAVLARIGSLPEGADRLARAAAILGDSTDARRAARLAGISDDRVGSLVEALAVARILEPSLVLTFVHPLVQAAVLAGFGPAGAAEAHRAAAVLLAEEGEPPEALVPHLLATDPRADPWVVATLREAARRAAARGAPASAARYLARALAEPPAAGELAAVLYDLGVAEAQAGSPEAVEHLARAARVAEGPAARATAARKHAWALATSGRVAEAVDACTVALDELGDQMPDLRQELEVVLITAATQCRQKRAVAATWHAQRRDAAIPEGPTAHQLHASVALEELLVLGSRERAITAAEQALQGGRLFADQASVTLPSAVVTLTLAGRLRRSIAVWDEALSVQRARGDLQSCTIAWAFRGLAFLYAGDLQEALADAQAALDLAGDTGQVLSIGYAAACLADALVETGDYGAAEKALTDQESMFGPDAPFTGNYLHAARGRLHLALGRYSEAAADLRECGRRVAAWGVRNPALCRWQAPLALALVGLGEPAEAAAVADAAVDLARRWGAPEPLTEALRAAGAVAGVDHRLALLREAAAVAERGESRLERAHALAALGSALRRAGLRREAREPLRAAIDLAAACGAAPLAGRAREDLVAAGARPRRTQSTGRAGLTPTELRVARMAAEGMTNRAVAQALFVSEKTIETHLGRAYRKLGVTARSQLGRALRSPAGEGLLG